MIKKLISLVIPAYNEEANLGELRRQLLVVFTQLPQYDFEVMIVDNGSTDSTWSQLKSFAEQDSRFKSIRLSRNFTAPGGITAGFKHVKGDAAIMLCADLQDPPERIPDFLKKWEDGFDIVYHIVSERRGISYTRKIASEGFHWIMSRLTNNAIPRNASVYRLLDKKAYVAFNNLTETNRYFPGLCNWIGFNSVGIEFPRAERFAGEAKSPFKVVLKLALNGIFSFSNVPLRLVTYFGLFVAGGSTCFLFYIVFLALTHGLKTVPGLATLLCITLLMFGALFLALGVIGEYLARIYDEVKGRPIYIVKDGIGIEHYGNARN